MTQHEEPGRSEPAKTLLARLTPDLREVICTLPTFSLDEELLPAMRPLMGIGTAPTATVARSEHVVDGKIRVRVHRPVQRPGGSLPCVVSMHGGGYVMGSYADDDTFFDHIVADLGVVGVAVDYRLAPETPYPGPLDDCYRALRWTHRNAEELGVDPARIGIRGSSAGGGLAAALALLAKQRSEVDVAFQLLDSPMLDDRQVTPSSRLDGLPVWSRESNRFGWQSYLGERYGSDDVPSTAAPARAGDAELEGLPATFLSVGAIDGFLDEDVEYARRLVHAGVPTELHVYAGACHGYSIAADTEVARRTRRDMREWLSRQVHQPS